MRVVDLDGSGFERGRQQGEQLRGDTERLMSDLLASSEWREHKPRVFPDRLLKPTLSAAGRTFTWPSVRKRLPHQAERVAGLARGLGVRRSFAWGVQFLEVVFCEAGNSLAPPPPVGCTVLLATPEATADGVPLAGRNYDFPTLLQPYQVVRREIPAEAGRLATTVLTQCALAGCHQGVNEAGLALSINNARLWRGADLRFRGVPMSMLVQDILETCSTTRQALLRVQQATGRSNAGFVGLCDAQGDACIVETTVRHTAVRRPDDAGVIAQANHFTLLTGSNLPEGTRWTVKGMEHVEYLVGSRARQDAALTHLHAASGEVSVATLQQVLSDHAGREEGGDDTVCAHGHTGGTLASMVVEPVSRRMWIADGQPCSQPYVEIPFRERGGRVAQAAK